MKKAGKVLYPVNLKRSHYRLFWISEKNHFSDIGKVERFYILIIRKESIFESFWFSKRAFF